MRRLRISVLLEGLCLLVGLAGPAAAQNSTLLVRLMDSLSTGSTQRGDTFNATLASPLIWRNRVVAVQGAHVCSRPFESALILHQLIEQRNSVARIVRAH